MAQCSKKLFNPNSKTTLLLVKNRITKLVKNIFNEGLTDAYKLEIKNFLAEYEKPNSRITFSANENNNEDDISQSVISLTKLLKEILDTVTLNPVTKNEILDYFANTLNLGLDDSQKYSTRELSDEEIKTMQEAAEKNSENLENHFNSLYGRSSIDITNKVKEIFTDSITSIAYYDPSNGKIAIQNNKELNKGIKELKNKHFRILVKYLKTIYSEDPLIEGLSEELYDKEGNLDSENYYIAISQFYKKFKEDPSKFKLDVFSDYSKFISEKTKAEKTQLYKKLIEIFEKDSIDTGSDEFESFKEEYGYEGNQLLDLRNNLYEADHFSKYFIDFKEFFENAELKEETRNAIRELISNIETDHTSLFEASSAYSILTQFDNLIEDALGKQISMKEDLKNFEINVDDKYFYYKDTAHERKSWQTSEDSSSEKHLSRFTKSVMNIIRIYNHKTGEFQNKRASTNTYISAVRNIFDAIDSKILNFGSSQSAIELVNRVKTFKGNPVENLQRISEILFTEGLSNEAKGNYLVSEADWNIMKSVYKVVFDKTNPNSFYSQSNKSLKNYSRTAQQLIEEVASLIDRNASSNQLETEVDFETGKVTVKVKKKYSTGKEFIKLTTGINSYVNNITIDKRKKLKDKYEYSTKTIDKSFIHNIKIKDKNNESDVSLKITIPNDTTENILTFNPNKASKIKIELEGLKTISDIDLVQFRKKLLSENAVFSDEEQKLKNVLEFLDDFLDLNLLLNADHTLQVLKIYKDIYDKSTSGYDNWLQPLLKMAVKSAYINDLYLKAYKNKSSLKKYLQENHKELYKATEKTRNTPLTTKFNNLKFVATNFTDKVLEAWVDAEQLLVGGNQKSTIKDRQGNSLPNLSVNKLANNLKYYLETQRLDGKASQYFWFVQNPSNLITTVNDLESTNFEGTSKSVKQFSLNELFYHSIFNKFWGTYLSNDKDHVIIQPTTYADKTTFPNWEIRTKTNNYDLMNMSEDDIIKMYTDTIGNYYYEFYKNTFSKLDSIVEEFFKDKEIPEGFDHMQLNQKLHLMSEQDLVKTADKLGFTVERNSEYRTIKNKEGKTVVAFNELVSYNAGLYFNGALSYRLKKEAKYFVEGLLSTNSYFKVLGIKDNYDDYLEDEIPEKNIYKNVILNTIVSYYKNKEDRIAFFKNWVDENTGNLILAKQTKNNPKTGEKEIVNIIDNSSDFNINSETTLNPLLSKFFYVESFLANNLRMSITGSEVSHPAGKNSPFNVYKKLAQNQSGKEVWNNILGLNIKDDNLIERLNNVLNNSLDLTDVIDFYDIADDLESQEDFPLLDILHKIIENSAIYNTNTSQGTQFKRNVIITATLQYLTPDSIEGPPSEIEVAVIEDEQAPVYNYKGDHEGTIDANDGSAKITAFQSILENKALGSQAVGFTKKPIWHDYDTNTGTVFLAKFATNTITNEEMRLSIGSNSSTYNMFKKMTNIQWDEPVDLTKPITSEESLGGHGTNDSIYTDWFNSVILRGNNLYYTNRYGEKIQILQLNKETFGENDENTVYYTEEKDISRKVNKVYHLFYNTENNESVHETFNSLEEYQKAFEKYSESEGFDPHTINSLFELHSALGGIYCCDSEGVSSEFNNEVVVNFMNYIGTAKEGVTDSDYIDQKHYHQPLKHYHIGYALNQSSVKVGIKNINPAKSWSDKSKLTTFKVKSLSLGMQMNADHDVINSELTEFSQVIAATAAYGYTYDHTNEIFQGLAKTAFEASEPLLKAMEKFLENIHESHKEIAISQLYDAIGRIMLVNESIKDKGNLTKIIMEGVRKIFDNYDLHTDDELKIPFSDPNIYGEFISTLASTITKNSIKRKHIGTGAVIVPSYNIAQTYNLLDKNGNRLTVLADDVLKRAIKDYKEELIQVLYKNFEKEEGNEYSIILDDGPVNLRFTSISKLEKLLKTLPQEVQNTISYKFSSNGLHETNKVLFETYLEKYQHPFKEAEYFMPSDIVEILDADGNTLQTVDLNSMDIYYKFKEEVQNKAFGEDTRFRINSKKPSNLRPSLIRWQYVADNEFTLFTDPDTGDTLYFNLEEISTLDGVNVEYLDDKTDASKIGPSVKITLEDQTEKGYFEIIKDDNSQNYFINFESGVDENGNPYKFSEKDKELFYKTIEKLLPNGALISILNPDSKESFDALNILSKNWAKTEQYQTLKNTEGKSVKMPVYQKAIIKYMNVFDMPAIKNAFLQNIDTNTPAHRKAVQDILHDLHEGKFTIDGKTYNILEGTLENEPAELIMGNIYKEIFGIENESLADIIEEGEEFFEKQIKNIKAPASKIYDIAFLKPDGKNTLISLRKVKPSQSVTEIGFQHTITNDKDEIFQLKKGEPGILIGKWVTVEDSSVTYDQKKKIFKSTKGIEINQNDYRFVKGKVQKKIDFVKRFSVLSKKKVKNSTVYVKEILYEIVNSKEIEKAYGNIKKEESKKIKADIVKNLYTSGDFSFPHFNFINSEYTPENKKRIVETVSSLVNDLHVDPDVRSLLKSQIDSFVSDTLKFDISTFNAIKDEFAKKQSRKKWISFQDSLKMIASRIPAQTLQSFMAMKIVGWNKNSTNMAYVSHFQTYLQGSK